MSKLLERLRDPARSGVYRTSDAKAILEATRGGGLDVVTIDMDPADLFSGIARALDFPDWFGANWDALADCLGDLSWRGGAGHVLMFARYPDGDARGILLDVLRSSAEYRAARGKPFFDVYLVPVKKLVLPDRDIL